MYERGETGPQAEVLARLLRALGVSVKEFFVGIGWQREPPRLLIESDGPTVDLESTDQTGKLAPPQRPAEPPGEAFVTPVTPEVAGSSPVAPVTSIRITEWKGRLLPPQ